MIQPETQFTSVGNDRVAYQVLGEGPRDLLLVLGFWSHMDIEWEDPGAARFFRRLASFSRLIQFDCRGTGASDRPSNASSSAQERWLQDCVAVLDAAGSAAPVILSMTTGDAGPLTLEFVDRYPERCSGLIFANTTSCWPAKPDYPQGMTPEAVQQIRELFLQGWGKVEFARAFAPSQAGNGPFLRWCAKLHRSVASPRAAVDHLDTALVQLDSRRVLPNIRVPALVMARAQYQLVPFAQSRYLADHIPSARFVELPGSDGFPAWETPDLILDHIEEFVTGKRHGGEAERTVATVMFTDIVGSTQRAAEMGNAAWRSLLDRHDKSVREQVALFRGRFIESSGDGTLATFNSPGAAIDCALALGGALKSLGIEIRAGLHTGEVELREDGRVGGMAVHIGARVLAVANPNEVLASRTVHDILIGSRYKFGTRGAHALKGVPGEWQLYALSSP